MSECLAFAFLPLLDDLKILLSSQQHLNFLSVFIYFYCMIFRKYRHLTFIKAFLLINNVKIQVELSYLNSQSSAISSNKFCRLSIWFSSRKGISDVMNGCFHSCHTVCSYHFVVTETYAWSFSCFDLILCRIYDLFYAHEKHVLCIIFFLLSGIYIHCDSNFICLARSIPFIFAWFYFERKISVLLFVEGEEMEKKEEREEAEAVAVVAAWARKLLNW